MVVAANPATALYEILNAVVSSGATTIKSSWEAVLGAQVGTSEFIERHCEVVGLLDAIHQRLLALPEGNRSRVRNLGYLPAWHVVVSPRCDWTTNENKPSKLIPATILEHLASLGEVFELRDSATSSAVEETSLDQLRASLSSWKELLEDIELPGYLADQIRQQVAHIEWLLDNVQLFGAQPVSAAANQLLGSGMNAMSRSPGLAKKAAVAVAAVMVFLTTVEDGVGKVQALVEGLGHLRESVAELVHPPQELPGAATPRELTSNGPGGDLGSPGIEDAEIIENFDNDTTSVAPQ